MEAGASVVAFAVLALQSAKLIYTVLGDLKDGPKNVQRAITNVNGLLSTLQQLSKCRALDVRGSKGLIDRTLICLKDLEAFSAKLEGLRFTKSEKRRGMYWKRIKTVLNEKDLDSMNDVVAGHTSALNLQLTALQSETVFQVPDQFDTIKQELFSQRTTRETETIIWREQQTELGHVSQNVSHISGSLDTIRKEVQVMSSSQAAGDSRMDDKLNEILQQLLTLKLEQQSSSRVVKVKDQDLHKPTPTREANLSGMEGMCSELVESMARLCRLADKKPGRAAPGESKDVIKSLLALVTWMMSGEFLQSVVTSCSIETKACSTCDGQHLEDLRTCVSSVYSVLLSARHIILNELDLVQQRTPGVWSQRGWTARAYDFGLGVLVVTSRTDSQGYQHPSQFGTEISNRESQSFVEEVTTSIALIPSRTQRVRQMLSITSHQRHKDSGVFSSIPKLSVNNILPADSPVFSIVREGRMQDFLALLRDGKASIRDHDEYGASLLHYSARQPDMCRFLIQSGLDVNSIAKQTGVGGSDFTDSIMAANIIHKDLTEREVEATYSCFKYLLNAGCDPTTPSLLTGFIDDYKDDCAAITAALQFGLLEPIKLLLDEGNCFVNVKTLINGNTLLLVLCTYGGWSEAGFDILLQRGSSVMERDPTGRICLHLCVRHHWMISSVGYLTSDYVRRCRDGLIYLIRHGADVLAKDNFGVSVSEAAYETHESGASCSNEFPKMGSFRGDMWDCVLASCGFDLPTFRRGHAARKSDYTHSYKRKHFEILWEGREHICPYYYDDESELPDRVECVDDEDGSEWTTDLEDDWPYDDMEDEGSSPKGTL